MPDTDKLNSVMEELVSLEKEVYFFIEEHKVLKDKYEELILKANRLEEENEVLRLKLEEMQEREEARESVAQDEETSLNSVDNENLKNRLDELISKLDHHLRS